MTTPLNAAKRHSYAGDIYETGIQHEKARVLASLPQDFAALHRDGWIHIHDLEAYGGAPNCVMVDVRASMCDSTKNSPNNLQLVSVVDRFFDFLQGTIPRLANEQTGGIGFANLDDDFAWFIRRHTSDSDISAFESHLRDRIQQFLHWINTSTTRYGQECYYVTINIGLSRNVYGRMFSRLLLDIFRENEDGWIRPNIVFKVNDNVNLLPDSPNHDLLRLAFETTARRMNPTWFFCKTKYNREFPAGQLGIMGCRTRVAQDIHPCRNSGSVGRGNVANVTVNLVRHALGVMHDAAQDRSRAEKLEAFLAALSRTLVRCADLLEDRYKLLMDNSNASLAFTSGAKIWGAEFSDATKQEVFQHGTLSIGFIGLNEALEVLIGEPIHSSAGHDAGIEIVRFMRSQLDNYTKERHRNYSLLATSGEYISGRFPQLDAKTYAHPISRNGYYSNSFHVNVAHKLSPFEKLDLEAPFHSLCNGGCITYIELREAPVENPLAIADIVSASGRQEVNYLGINFPLDYCRDCGQEGTFDKCTSCGSSHVRRIRRVSGYLEDAAHFTSGKVSELADRRPST